MESIRQKKVASLIQQELAGIFQKESQSMFGGAMITVTVVRMSPDLAYAKSYVSIFAPGQKQQEVMNEIHLQNSTIRGMLGKIVGKQLRIVPELQFYLDDSLDYAEEIDRLLNK